MVVIRVSGFGFWYDQYDINHSPERKILCSLFLLRATSRWKQIFESFVGETDARDAFISHNFIPFVGSLLHQSPFTGKYRDSAFMWLSFGKGALR